MHKGLAKKILEQRGITDPQEQEYFLNPRWENIHDPFLMKDMKKAIERVFKAIKQNEKIAIYSDYDADGIPGAVILSDLFEKIKFSNYEIYIPHREQEGYGLNKKALQELIQRKAKLILTIDLGITAVEEAKFCKEKNVDLIITDHHLPIKKGEKEILPYAYAILNPKRKGDQYPEKMLCGSGVIFKFIQAFLEKYRKYFQVPKGWEKWLLDMLGIATLADMVPLQGENRIFAYYGLKVIQKIMKERRSRRPGLVSLLKGTRKSWSQVSEDDIYFFLAPRINAASRISHPTEALSVFLAKKENAQKNANFLEQLNQKRKEEFNKIFAEAETMLNEKKKKNQNYIIVGKEGWRHGLLGLVASRLSEKYLLPSFVWTKEEGIIKGSCRSIEGISLPELMQKIKAHVLLQFGGHEMAGGFSLKEENLEEFIKELSQKIKKRKEERKVIFDIETSLDEIDENFFHEIQKLAPFGVGNEKVRILLRNVFVSSIREFGKKKDHLIFTIHSNYQTKEREREVVSFFKRKKDFPKLQEGKRIDIIVYLEKNFFKKKEELRFKLIQIL